MRSLRSPAPTSFSQHNTWHSSVPYLFGGLAVMLGLITLALLFLVCSYWRLSRYLDDEGDRNYGEGDRNSNDHPGGNVKQADSDVKPPPCSCKEFVVIMAGDQKPTFLAMPKDSKVTATVNELQGGDRNQEH